MPVFGRIVEIEAKLQARISELEQENKELKEFKEKREESMFYFKAQMERAEPKTAREAEDLQKAKKIFENMYNEKLYLIEKENKKMRKRIKELEKMCERYEIENNIETMQKPIDPKILE